MIIRFLRGLTRHIRDAIRNFFRNFSLSLSALAAINVTLIVVSFSIIVGYNFDLFTSDVEDNAQIIAFVRNDVTDEELTELTANLNSHPYIEEVIFSSKEDQLTQVGQDLGEFEKIASQFQGEENPLMNAYYIKVKDIGNIKEVQNYMVSVDKFEIVEYGEEVVNKVVKLFNIARIVAIVIIFSLILVTIFIIYNTIRITLYSRSTEVEIMKLIGGSNYHIRTPFIFEGVLIGFFGSMLPIIATIFGYRYLYENYNDSVTLGGIIQFIEPEVIVYKISAGLLLSGVLVGIFGSVLSVRSFLRK